MSRSRLTTAQQARLESADRLEQGGEVLQAELLYAALLNEAPDHAELLTRLARLALNRRDLGRAVGLLEQAVVKHPGDASIGCDLATVLRFAGEPARAMAVLEAALARTPDFAPGWLLLARLRNDAGDSRGGLRASFEAVTRAQRAGEWLDEASTPAHLLDAVVEAIERVRLGRRDLFFGAYDDLRAQHGDSALRRVDRALAGYLRESPATPAHPRQRPKFLFFPDLPNAAYHDPESQPWAERLRAAFPVIRDEALRVIEEDRALPNFVHVKAGDRLDNYVGGAGPHPAWEAFFFFRHGARFDRNHARCPRTSEVLESIDLCRIADQAPEICFSVLRAGSHIKPHHGVTNTRLVMHLPLIVPGDCALNLLDVGEHRWKEGELVMFDDTFEHEAWNRSDATRVVLLMDCWNPHLSDVERRAVKQLIETISSLQLAGRVHDAHGRVGA